MTRRKQREPAWLTEPLVLEVHAMLIKEFGGPTRAVRDINLLGSALGRARNKWAYDSETHIPNLAAAYGFGLVKNHPFVDGNKRSALLAIAIFLEKSGLRLVAAEEQAVLMIQGLASGEFDETSLAAWIRDNCMLL